MTNFYFNNFRSSQEQQLLDNLTREMINIHGEDMYYVPRVLNNLDKLYMADDQSSYEQTFQIPVYIENFSGFTGNGTFASQFGVEIRDQVIFSVSQSVFSEEVSAYTSQVRPNEGDLIYFPLNNKCFQIKFVEKFAVFYQLGKLYTWKMTCELFEYSNEILSTGIDAIDSMQTNLSTNILDYALLTENDDYLFTENDDYLVVTKYDLDVITGTGTNDDIQAESDDIIDFSVDDPFSEGQL